MLSITLREQVVFRQQRVSHSVCLSFFFSLSGSVSDELPLNITAEVHCLKGTTPKTTEKEETTVAAVQTQPSEAIRFSHPLSLSFIFKEEPH